MDKATKDTLLKNKDSLSADALEKRKKINKSILKFFFIPAFFLFLIVVVAAMISEKPDSNVVETSEAVKAQQPEKHQTIKHPKEENSIVTKTKEAVKAQQPEKHQPIRYSKKKDGVVTEIIENPAMGKFHSPINEPAAQTAIQFLKAWSVGDWQTMTTYTQKRWKNRQNNPENLLSSQFGELQLLSAEVESVDQDTDYSNMCDVEIKLRYSYSPVVKTETIKIKVINEENWGVNPISVNLKGRRGIALEALDAQNEIAKNK